TWPVRAEAPRLAHGNAQLAAWGQSMIDAEDLVYEANERYGMEYAILRPTVVCGRTAKFAESVISGLMRNPERAEQLNAAWGTMQWVHGVDVARAALIAGHDPAARNETFIVAGPEIVTAFGLLETLWEITHMEGGDNPFSGLAKEKQPPLRKFDIGKIQNALDFTAEATVRQCVEELLGLYEFYSSASLKMPQSPGVLQIE
ncbi:MAG: NAD(P)-dependent oxidoreductase, partial [Methylocella sp.]